MSTHAVRTHACRNCTRIEEKSIMLILCTRQMRQHIFKFRRRIVLCRWAEMFGWWWSAKERKNSRVDQPVYSYAKVAITAFFFFCHYYHQHHGNILPICTRVAAWIYVIYSLRCAISWWRWWWILLIMEIAINVGHNHISCARYFFFAHLREICHR